MNLTIKQKLILKKACNRSSPIEVQKQIRSAFGSSFTESPIAATLVTPVQAEPITERPSIVDVQMGLIREELAEHKAETHKMKNKIIERQLIVELYLTSLDMINRLKGIELPNGITQESIISKVREPVYWFVYNLRAGLENPEPAAFGNIWRDIWKSIMPQRKDDGIRDLLQKSLLVSLFTFFPEVMV